MNCLERITRELDYFAKKQKPTSKYLLRVIEIITDVNTILDGKIKLSGVMLEDKKIIKIFGEYKNFLVNLSRVFKDYDDCLEDINFLKSKADNTDDPIIEDEIHYQVIKKLNNANYTIHKLAYVCLNEMLRLKDDQPEIKLMCKELKDYLNKFNSEPPKIYI